MAQTRFQLVVRFNQEEYLLNLPHIPVYPLGQVIESLLRPIHGTLDYASLVVLYEGFPIDQSLPLSRVVVGRADQQTLILEVRNRDSVVCSAEYEEEDCEMAVESEKAVLRPAPARKSASVEEKKKEAVLPPRLTKKQATVRYFSRMNPERAYPLLIVLSKSEIKTIVQKGVAEARAQIGIHPDVPVELEPVLPGCVCYPPRECVDVSQGDASAKFWVVPHVRGKVAAARIVVRQQGKVVSEIPLRMAVSNPVLVTLMGLGALVLPFGSALLRHYNLDFESQFKEGFIPYLSILGWLTNNVRPEWLALGMLCLAGIAYLVLRPRRSETFWDFVAKRPAWGNWAQRLSNAFGRAYSEGKTAALAMAATTFAIGLVISGSIGLTSTWERALTFGPRLTIALVLFGLLGGFIVGGLLGFMEKGRAEGR